MLSPLQPTAWETPERPTGTLRHVRRWSLEEGCRMLSDRERQLLTDIEQQLRTEDPSLAYKFEGAARPAPAGHQRLIATALGVLALLAACAVLFGSPGMAVAFALIAGTIALLWYVLSSEMGSNEASLGIGSRRTPDSRR